MQVCMYMYRFCRLHGEHQNLSTLYRFHANFTTRKMYKIAGKDGNPQKINDWQLILPLIILLMSMVIQIIQQKQSTKIQVLLACSNLHKKIVTRTHTHTHTHSAAYIYNLARSKDSCVRIMKTLTNDSDKKIVKLVKIYRVDRQHYGMKHVCTSNYTERMRQKNRERERGEREECCFSQRATL